MAKLSRSPDSTLACGKHPFPDLVSPDAIPVWMAARTNEQGIIVLR